MFWRCCDDGDGKMIIMTESAGSNFSGKILCMSFRELVVFVLIMSLLLLVSWWFLTCVSVVVGVLAVIWRCVRQSRRCSVMFRVLLMFSCPLAVHFVPRLPRKRGGDQGTPGRTSDPLAVHFVPRLPRKRGGDQGTPGRTSDPLAVHFVPRLPRKRGGDQGTPGRTSDPLAVHFVPRLPRKRSGDQATDPLAMHFVPRLPRKRGGDQGTPGRTSIFFFSSGLAVNALWHGPDRYMSGEKSDTQHNWLVSKSKANQYTNKTNNHPKHDDPQIPQPDLRFALSKAKQRKRGRAQTKTPTLDALRYSGL